jgi:hypothetical protein
MRFRQRRAGFVAGSGRTPAEIAAALSDFVGRPVIDKTGLTGMYDFTLRFAPEVRPRGAAGVFAGPVGPAAPVDPDAPSFAGALPRLRRTKNPDASHLKIEYIWAATAGSCLSRRSPRARQPPTHPPAPAMQSIRFRNANVFSPV